MSSVHHSPGRHIIPTTFPSGQDSFFHRSILHSATLSSSPLHLNVSKTSCPGIARKENVAILSGYPNSRQTTAAAEGSQLFLQTDPHLFLYNTSSRPKNGLSFSPTRRTPLQKIKIQKEKYATKKANLKSFF